MALNFTAQRPTKIGEENEEVFPLLHVLTSDGKQRIAISRIALITAFLGYKMPKERAKKTGINLIIVQFYIRRKLDTYDTMLDIIFRMDEDSWF